MKKILCLLLAILTLVSVVACGEAGNDVAGSDSTGKDTEASTTVQKIDAEPYDGVFKAGFARIDVTPKVPIKKKDGSGSYTKVNDSIYLTCVAVNDGENTALLLTLDVSSIGASMDRSFKKYITSETGIPAENIMISATHTHTAPAPGFPTNDSVATRWLVSLNNSMADAAKEAIADLADAEIYNGTTVVKGMAFVRRGYAEDGEPIGIWRGRSTADMVKYESEADNSVQILRFVREDKKDIVMANLQTHFTEAGEYLDSAISADIADTLRVVVEMQDEDALFGVYVGASGNINTKAYVKSTKKFGSYQKMAKTVAEKIVAATPDLKKVEAGKIQTTAKVVTTNVRKDDADTIAKAQAAAAEIKALKKYDGDAEVYAIAKKYGFESAKEVTSTVSRNTNYGPTRDHTIGAISFGDIAFVSAPYEMFDTNGMEIKQGSPYDMTFVLTNAGGAGAYVPSALAVPNGGYEVYTAVDEFGTAERMVSEFLSMLKEHKGIS